MCIVEIEWGFGAEKWLVDQRISFQEFLRTLSMSTTVRVHIIYTIYGLRMEQDSVSQLLQGSESILAKFVECGKVQS
jgi:hypothetical protein